MSSTMDRKWPMDAVNRSEVIAIRDELLRLTNRLAGAGSQDGSSTTERRASGAAASRDEIAEIKFDMQRLTSRLANVTEDIPRMDSSVVDTAGKTEITDESDDQRHIPILTNANTIAEVRPCNFAQFKNRFTEEDGLYAVDVLVSGPLLEGEYKEEKAFRERHSRNVHEKHTSSKKKQAKAEALTRRMNQSANRALREAQQSDVWIRRIRIQSPALLKIMANIQQELWSTTPRTYHRPFSSLVYFHPQMKEELGRLEAYWGSEQDGVASPATTDSGIEDPGNVNRGAAERQETVEWSPAALKIMRAYVAWFDKEIILKEVTQFDKLDWQHTNASIWFYDLAFLFRVGELVIRPLEGDSSSGKRDLRAGKRIWRVFAVKPCDTQVQHTHVDHRRYDAGRDVGNRDDALNFVIKAYYIDWTGEEFCVVPKSFVIAPYQGPRPITSLPVYPSRFSDSWEITRKQAQGIGERVLRFLGDDHRHGSYNGWTVIRTPGGDPMIDNNGEPIKHAEHVNSEVMVDASEAFQVCPSWKPKRTILRAEVVDQEIVSDEFPLLWWSDPDRTILRGETSELVPTRTGVSIWAHNKYVTEEDKLLAQIAKNDEDGNLTTMEQLAPDDAALITGRVFGYVFQERKFAPLDVQKLQFSAGASDHRIAPMDTEALQALTIKWRIKAVIQDSVQGHLLQRAVERQTGEERQSLDLIQGKGAGLFILLHGVPGVGKTATAEAVAQANCKPLFKITCGDLGLTPQEVETSLRGIFRLASLWDCILLLDEVDTFFSQRSKGDGAMTKNALVSVFLRVLDYYQGILFLTTNRAGSLDEAFKSRIHLKVYYDHLDWHQTLEIWRNNIQRLKQIENRKGFQRVKLQLNEEDIERFANELFETNRRMNIRWNGRQIRNAFQIARSLAYTEAWTAAEEQSRRTGAPAVVFVLNIVVRHFQLVARITKSFDKYMSSVYSGTNDSGLAKEKEERDDTFKDDTWDGRQPSIRPPSTDDDDEEERSSYTRPTNFPSNSQSKASKGAGYTPRLGPGGSGRYSNSTKPEWAPPSSPGLSPQQPYVTRQRALSGSYDYDGGYEEPTAEHAYMSVPPPQHQQRASSPAGGSLFILGQPASRRPQQQYVAGGSQMEGEQYGSPTGGTPRHNLSGMGGSHEMRSGRGGQDEAAYDPAMYEEERERVDASYDKQPRKPRR